MSEIKMAQKEKMEQSKNSEEPKICHQMNTAENSVIRFERYQQSKTVCVQVTSCPHKAILKYIPKVSSQIYKVQHLKSFKRGWSGMAKISSKIPIQKIQMIKIEIPKSIPSNPTVNVDLPSDNELSSVEFNIPSLTNNN